MLNIIKELKHQWYNYKIDKLDAEIDLFYVENKHFFATGNKDKRDYELFTIVETTPIYKLKRMLRELRRDFIVMKGDFTAHMTAARTLTLYQLALLEIKAKNYRELRLNLLFPRKK